MLQYLLAGGEFTGIDTDGGKAPSDILYFEPGSLQDGCSNGRPIATGTECEVVMATVRRRKRGREKWIKDTVGQVWIARIELQVFF